MNDLALHLLDIVQNSLSAGASLISIRLEEHVTENLLKMIVEDNGRGMTQEQVQKLSDPFLLPEQPDVWGWCSFAATSSRTGRRQFGGGI